MVTRRPLTVVDLDGTLIAGNSLRVFIRCALSLAWKRRQWAAVARIGTLALLRSLRLVSHRTMKFGILRHVGADGALRHEFVRRIEAMRRPEVQLLLAERRARGHAILLATAAADIYVPWVWNGDYVATPVNDNPGRRECRSTAKVQAVRQFAADRNMTVDTVITDHHDDLALLTAGAAHNILVCPSTATLNAATMAGVKGLEVIR